MLRNGSLSAGHAKILVTLENAEALAKEIVKRGLSVREAERLVKESQTEKKPAAKTKKKPTDTVALEKELSATLGLKVNNRPQPGYAEGPSQHSLFES